MEISNISQTITPGAAAAKNEVSDLHRLAGKINDPDKNVRQSAVREASQKFESIFIRMILQQMRKTIPETGLFGNKSYAMDLYRDMMDDTLAEELGRAQGLGIAKMMQKEWEKNLDAGQTAGNTPADSAHVVSTTDFLSARGQSMEARERNE